MLALNGRVNQLASDPRVADRLRQDVVEVDCQSVKLD